MKRLFIAFGLVFVLILSACSVNTKDNRGFYTITFDPNCEDATGSTDSIQDWENTIVGLTGNGFVRDGFIFSSWNTKKDGTGKAYGDMATIKLTGDLILYAQWEKKVFYTITFDPNCEDATGSTNSIQDWENTIVTLPQNGFHRDGFTFSGWNTERDGSGIRYLDKDSIYLDRNLTLYAQWKINVYTITFNPNCEDATGSTNSVQDFANKTVTLPQNGFSREGFTFTGWNTKKDGTGTPYANNAVIKLTENIYLYAQWVVVTVPTYSITVSPVENGIVNVSKSISEVGSVITVIITPDEFYTLDSILITDENSNITIATNQTNTNVFSFTMPDKNVNVNVSFKYIAYSISVPSIQNGNILVNKNIALAGDVITINVTTEDYYDVDTITIKKVDNTSFTPEKNQNTQKSYSFVMPDQNVTIEVSLKYIVHRINVASIQNGSASVSKSMAVSGDLITITLLPDEFYVVDTITVKGINNTLIDVTANQNNENFYTFTMPDCDVNVSVFFKNALHAITVCETENGTVKISSSTAIEGQRITFTLNPNNYYELDSIVVKTPNNNKILVSGSNNTYYFIMPDSDVEIKVSYTIISYSVSFVTDCGMYISEQKIQRNNLVNYVSIDDNDESAGFLGWYTSSDCTDETLYNFDTPVTNNIKLYAKWAKFKVTSGTIVKRIKSLHYSCTIVGTEDLSYESGLIGNISEALETLYSVRETVCVTFDFALANIRIPGYSFKGIKNLISIILPNNLTSIGDYAFSGCSGLTYIEIPNNLTSIGDHAFRGCSGLTYIEIPNSVISIGGSAFSECSSLETVIISNRISTIEAYSFYRCTSLKTITIPGEITSIKRSAFEGCISLKTVSIPGEITGIEDSAFIRCTSLETFTIKSGGASIGSSVFEDCTSLKSVSIIGEITSIGNKTFKGCSSLENFDIPENCLTIGDSAFSECSSLTRVTIATSVLSIGDEAFYKCISLQSIDIPNNVNSIGEKIFYYCTSLETVSLGNNVTCIPERAFLWCSSLKGVLMSNRTTSIGTYAFCGCSSLTQITITSNINCIMRNAFEDCNLLSEVDFEDTNSSWLVQKSIYSDPLEISLGGSYYNAQLLTKKYKDYDWTKIIE